MFYRARRKRAPRLRSRLGVSCSIGLRGFHVLGLGLRGFRVLVGLGDFALQ